MHPSHKFHEDIDQKLRTAGGDSSVLSEKELHFLRAYELDSYLQNEGLEGYFWAVPNPSHWNEAVDALRDVGAANWAEVFANMLKRDGNAIEAAVTGDEWEEDELPLSKDYDAQLLELRAGADDTQRARWMEDLLDQFVTR